ncbi:MAG TPA: LegC family aminotransferase [Syntrophorhabdaceae bacterium]|jgi:perosamine synthetase
MTTPLDMDRIVKAIRSVIPESGAVALHEPCFRGNEWAYLKDCLDSTFVSYVGAYVDKFESMLAEFTGTKRAVAVVNGTAALHIALKLAGVEPGDEVLVPALTFVATANAVTYCGAIPHFIDSEEGTLGVDPHKLADYLKDAVRMSSGESFNKFTGRRIRAIVPVHVFGHPVDMDPLMEACREYSIEVVEDAAEALGSYYKGEHTGNKGKISVLSFNGNKTITTGGGGAILSNDEKLASHAKYITSTAKVPHRWEYTHDYIGYNYRLPNINAAVGCAQMEQLPGFLKQKRHLTGLYEKAFEGIGGIRLFLEPPLARSNYWLNALVLDEIYAGTRDELLDYTNNNGIMTRPAWTLINKLVPFKDCPAMDLSCAERLAKRLINIPSSPFLGRGHE